jgi:predicted nucleotidyltransferase
MIKLKRTREIEIELEEAQNLVAQVLQEDFDFISKEINELRSKAHNGRLKSYEAEDLSHNLDVREAMRRLMQYYMTRNDYNEFMELQRVYGNV